MNKIRLTKSFTYEEFTVSQTAINKGIWNVPNLQQYANLCRTAHFMQVIRDHFKIPIVPSSVFRSKKLNDDIGGSGSSWHMHGLAVDFVISGLTVNEAIEIILTLDLPFMEIINEHESWIHIAFAPIGVTPTKKLKVFK